MRWDHCSLVVSEAISYTEDTTPLAAFLKAFTSSDPATRGWDMSVNGLVLDPEAVEIRAKIAPLLGTLSPERQAKFTMALQKFRVPHLEGAGFYTCYASVDPDYLTAELISRATRCWVVYVKDDNDGPGRLAYYKRAWRLHGVNLEQEGAVLAVLRRRGVEHIPTLMGHGDLPGKWQRTLLGTDLGIAKKPWARRRVIKQIRTHQHYQLLVEEVGMPLKDYDCSKTLAQAVFDALNCESARATTLHSQVLNVCPAAHQGFTKAKYMHRDISDGNILIYNGRGVLADWEFAKKVGDDGRVLYQARAKERTGTWTFVSIHFRHPVRFN
jgi:hypothetical protein